MMGLDQAHIKRLRKKFQATAAEYRARGEDASRWDEAVEAANEILARGPRGGGGPVTKESAKEMRAKRGQIDLTDDEVRAIRARLVDHSVKDVAKEFGKGRQVIERLKRGETYKHVPK